MTDDIAMAAAASFIVLAVFIVGVVCGKATRPSWYALDDARWYTTKTQEVLNMALRQLEDLRREARKEKP